MDSRVNWFVAFLKYHVCNIDLIKALEILNLLWFFGMNTRGNYTDSAFPNTCSWILENDHYKTWSSKGGILWITRRPGSGKSIMMKYLVNALEQSSSENDISHALFFFRLGGRSTTYRPFEFFRALLFQLLL